MADANTPIEDRYRDDGYVFPINVLTVEQATGDRATLEAALDACNSDPVKLKILFSHANYVLPFVDRISRMSSVLDPVRAILGPDLLVWGISLFMKEPHSPNFVSWHQDLRYWDLDDADEVTAWIALSPATLESGCMRFLPGSHSQNIVEHRDTFSQENMLSRGQEIAVEIDEDQTVDVILAPGQMSLHHGRLFHASHPNRSNDRRIGLAIRYIPPAMRQLSGVKPGAHLVSGEDRQGNFELLQPPSGTLTDSDMAAARRSMALEESFLYSGTDQQGKRLP